MHIRKLQIVTRDEHKQIYQFSPGSRAFRYHYSLYVEHASDQSLVLDALKTALMATSSVGSPFLATELECYDDLGTIWTIRRSDAGTEILRDGETVGSSKGASDAAAKPSTPKAQASASSLALDIAHLHRTPFGPRLRRALKDDGLGHSVETRIQAQLAAIRSAFKLSQEADDEALIERIRSASDPCKAYRAQLRAAEALEGLNLSVRKRPRSGLDEFTIGEHISLLRKVEGCFLNYQRALTITGGINEQLRENENELRRTETRLGPLAQRLSSHQDLYNLSMLYLFHQLGTLHEGNARKAEELIDGLLHPKFQSYLQEIEQVTLASAQVSAKIDMELRSGHAEVRADATDGQDLNLFSAGRSRLRKFLGQLHTLEEVRERFRAELNRYFNEVSHLTIGLGELREKMQQSQVQYRKLRQQGKEALETEKGQYAEFIQLWREQATELGLAADLSFPEFFSLIDLGMRKLILSTHSSSLAETNGLLNGHRAELVKTIEEWRLMTKSVHTFPLNDDAVLIGEARKLSRQLQEKEELKRSLAESQAIQIAEQRMQDLVDSNRSRLAKIGGEILQAIGAAGSAPKPTNASEANGNEAHLGNAELQALEDFLELMRHYEFLLACQDGGHDGDAAPGQAPFQALIAGKHGLSRKDLKLLLTKGSHASSTRDWVIFTSRLDDHELLKAEGCGLGKLVASMLPRSSSSAQPSSHNPASHNPAAAKDPGMPPLMSIVIKHGVAQPRKIAATQEGSTSKRQAGLTLDAMPSRGQNPSPSRMEPPLQAKGKESAALHPALHPLAKHDKPLSAEAKRALEVLTAKPRARAPGKTPG